MSTIQQLHRALAFWVKPNGITPGFAIRLALTLTLSITVNSAQAQDRQQIPVEGAPRFSEEDRSFDTVSITGNETKVDLIENNVKILNFNEKIISVDGFDGNVVGVDALSPNRLRLRGLQQQVTTMTVTGESGRRFLVHVQVLGDCRLIEAVLRRHFPNSSIQCAKLANGDVLLTGYVTDTQTTNQILEVVRSYSPNVINQMRVGGPQEVQLRVKILEVQRSKIRTFGLDLQGLGQNAAIVSSPGSIAPLTGLINPIGGTPSFSAAPSGSNSPSLTAGFNTNHFAFNAFLQALKEEGLLKFHTTPMVITRSGEPARISDGGEFPIPVPGGLGTIAIEFREFGVTLETIPTVISPTRVRQQVHVTVSDRDTSVAVVLQGTSVPGLSKREIENTVEMNFGETMVIGGLLNRREQGSTLKTPFLGELPLIGAAFRKVIMKEAETELIIMITPEFGSSIPTDQIPPGGPGMSTTVPTDKELYGHGYIEVPKYGPDCGPDCNNNLSNGSGGNCFPSNNEYPTTRMISPGPSIPPSISPPFSPPINPSSGGLINPSEMKPADQIPPEPSDNLQTKRLSGRSSPRSSLSSKTRPSGSTKPKGGNSQADSDSVQPAGFLKSLKSK